MTHFVHVFKRQVHAEMYYCKKMYGTKNGAYICHDAFTKVSFRRGKRRRNKGWNC